MRTLCLLLIAIPWTLVHGQNTLTVVARDASTQEILPGANGVIDGTAIGASADRDGIIHISGIPDGKYVLVLSMVGYNRMSLEITFPRVTSDPITVALIPLENELEEVIVSTTRGSRTIADEPTRIEVVSVEELDEKANMEPGDIRMLLTESTGIHVQQTSATTASAGIRIQGLEGRYTQILKDGFPLYSGFSGGLSIMQIPPLDLQQVEVIKGSASTLYGGGAIAGLVNLISKPPSGEPELRLHLNGTSAGGLDLNGFYSRKVEDVGLTLFVARNSNAPYDPAGIDLTAIPKFERYTVNPRVFVKLGDRSSLVVGVNATREDRLGGDIHYIEGRGDSIHSYFEKNTSQRIASQASLEYRPDEHVQIKLKNSIGYFDRSVEMREYRFGGEQFSTFTEATALFGDEETEWIAGASLVTERFTEASSGLVPARNYRQLVPGAFVQNTWKAGESVSLETGVRVDYAKDYGAFVLPRVSVLLRPAADLTSRIGGGLGYKLPSVFTEESELRQFKNILPINEVWAERSLGGNVDVNYRTILPGEVSFTFNQLFYYTRLNRPVVLVPVSGENLSFVNASGHLDTRGLETNIRLGYADFKLLIGYTLTDAKRHFVGELTEIPLTPRHRLNMVLIYEEHDAWRVGLEAYYFDRQLLTDGTTGRSYWICGLMAEKMWDWFSLYINFENFFDSRQTRYGSIYTGTIMEPQFTDIYASLEGFVVNGGVKLRF